VIVTGRRAVPVRGAIDFTLDILGAGAVAAECAALVILHALRERGAGGDRQGQY